MTHSTDRKQPLSTAGLAWGVPLLWAAVGAWSWACQSDAGSDTSGDEADTSDDGSLRRDVLASVGHSVIVPASAAFADSASELEAATAVHAEAVAADPGTATEATAAAQEAFRAAMIDWQAIEVMQVGPLGPSASAVAGEDIRDEVYSWPVVNTCRVDQRIADGTYASATFFEDNLVNAYGFVALEYLLFHHDAGHTCPTQVGLDATWPTDVAELESRRAAYALVLATEIARHADAIATRWSPTGEDFAGLLAEPGVGDSPYESEAQALDEVFHAMFYVDLTTKDAKLGRTLGLADGCAAVPCPELLEAPYSDLAGPALIANLRALRLLVTGGPDPATAVGFDDLLLEADHPEIAETLLADIDATIALVESIDAPMQDVAIDETARVQAIYDGLKRVTDTLKGPFVMVLRLTIPSEGAGDAD
jgi:predicted lipoprotein